MRWSGILGLLGLLSLNVGQSYAAQTDQTAEQKVFETTMQGVTQDELSALAAKKQWADLLHYRRHPFTFRYMSQNDSEEFFLAANGKYDLQAELTADVQAFLQTAQAADQSAQCRFPARYQWIKKQLPQLSFVDQPCPEFAQWAAELDARYITLIFPASHINSPSSMYGHTLIRLDRADENSSKLLSYAVNFAANADPTDNELKFSYKGLTGGYPGVVSVMPYYVKTNEYQHMEYRDIWEYRLNLDEQEVAQFVRHIWENQDTYYDYFFFDENCSYRIIALLDAASERVELADAFQYKAVPVDTIRALEQNDLVDKAEYRPSAATELENKSAQSSPLVLKVSRELVEADADIEPALAGMSEQEQVRTLDLAYAYARYLSVKKKQANPLLRKRTLDILSARSKRTADAGYTPVAVPQWRDDHGHLTMRAGMRGGMISDNDDQSGFAELRLRMAYHDILDPVKGFVPGAQIQMGQFDLRAWDNGDVSLQQALIIDVLSLSNQTAFQSPLAWGVSFGFERFAFERAELYSYLKVAFGKAVLNDAGRFYALGEIQALADNQFDDGYQLTLGPRVGWLWQSEKVQAQLEANWQPLTTGDDTERTTLKASAGYVVSDNQQLRINAERQTFTQDSFHYNVNQFSGEYAWYF